MTKMSFALVILFSVGFSGCEKIESCLSRPKVIKSCVIQKMKDETKTTVKNQKRIAKTAISKKSKDYVNVTPNKLKRKYSAKQLAYFNKKPRWKVVLMTGDNSIHVFDNARKKIKKLLKRRGVKDRYFRELSMTDSEQIKGVQPSSYDNFNRALASLNISERDGCFVHIGSHGLKNGVYMINQPILTPAQLDESLTTHCKGRPTVVMVSACYSGVFISDEVMKKPNRIIFSAARHDRTSFGCSNDYTYTYWDRCLVDNLNRVRSWNALYKKMNSCVTKRETEVKVEKKSLPQFFVGENARSYRMPLPNRRKRRIKSKTIAKKVLKKQYSTKKISTH